MSTIESKDRCNGPFALLWEVAYDYQFQIRIGTVYGDSEFVGFETRTDVSHVIAPTEEQARIAFRHFHPLATDVFKSAKALLIVDAIMKPQRLDWRS